jgi:hypothetical protein
VEFENEFQEVEENIEGENNEEFVHDSFFKIIG